MNEFTKKTLEKYKRNIITAKMAKYYVGLGTRDINDLIDAYNELYPLNKENYTTCAKCVLNILNKLYPYLEELEHERADSETQEKENKRRNGVKDNPSDKNNSNIKKKSGTSKKIKAKKS